MKTLLSNLKLHNISNQYLLQADCDSSEQINSVSTPTITNKPFGYEARENITRGIPKLT